MNLGVSPQVEGYESTEDDAEYLIQPKANQSLRKFSEDELPAITSRQTTEPSPLRNADIDSYETQPVPERSQNHFNNVKDNEHEAHLGNPFSIKYDDKRHKKPRPHVWAAKPISKNDMEAKKAVIKEIEGFWGKNFIESHIPKCHHPFSKDRKHGRRSTNRTRETNPNNWLPSILKAILIIAKLTDDKKWLKDAMNEVVRYRIKHTGNRKPQLATTDFDVIEDMLVRDWSISYAFEIRYKYLPLNRKDQEETDDNINHILYVDSDQDNTSNENFQSYDTFDTNDQGKMDEDRGREDKKHQDDGHKPSPLHIYASPFQRIQAPFPPHHTQQSKRSGLLQPCDSTITQMKRPYTYDPYNPYKHLGQVPSYGPPGTNTWNASMLNYDASNGYRFHEGYAGYYGYSQFDAPHYFMKSEGEISSHQPLLRNACSTHHPAATARTFKSKHTIHSKNKKDSSSQDRHIAENDLQIPAQNIHRFGIQSGSQDFPICQRIKRESSAIDERFGSSVKYINPTNNLNLQDYACESSAAIAAAVETAELELKVARLRARQSALKKAK